MLLIHYDSPQGLSMLEAQRSRRFHDMAESRVSVFLTAERGHIPHSPLNPLGSQPQRATREYSQRIELRLESTGLGILAPVTGTAATQPELLVGKFNAELEVEFQLLEIKH